MNGVLKVSNVIEGMNDEDVDIVLQQYESTGLIPDFKRDLFYRKYVGAFVANIKKIDITKSNFELEELPNMGNRMSQVVKDVKYITTIDNPGPVEQGKELSDYIGVFIENYLEILDNEKETDINQSNENQIL